MSGDFEQGVNLTMLALLVCAIVAAACFVTYAAWVAVHPLVAVAFHIPWVGGLANVGIQRALRARRGA